MDTFKLIDDNCIEEMKKHSQLLMSKRDEPNFRCAEQCYICSVEYTRANYKVRDHCHRTGNYRGAAHTTCNINY